MEKEISTLKKKIATFPDGKLIVVQNGNYLKWFQSNGHKKTYIPKKQRVFAEKLAVKKYLMYKLNDLLHEKDAIEQYLHKHKPIQSELLLNPSSNISGLLAPYFSPSILAHREWMNAPYEFNQKYPEQLIHKSSSGHLVRSKSEEMIANFLYLNNIPFRYECVLPLDGINIYPDFTILHPKTNEIYYWEHFGLMDDPSYIKNTYSKLQLYSSHGFIPSIRLITTYETRTSPLSSENIQQLIHYHFM